MAEVLFSDFRYMFLDYKLVSYLTIESVNAAVIWISASSCGCYLTISLAVVGWVC